MPIPQIGEVVSREQFNKLYPTGETISGEVFRQRFEKAEPQKTEAEISTERFKPSFPATERETMLTAPLKTVANIPASAFQFAKGIVNFLNPLTTVKTAMALGEELGVGIEEIGGKKLAVETIKQIPKTTYEIVMPEFVKNLIRGDIEEAQKIIINDPVGQIAPLIIMGRAVAGKVGQGAAFDKVMTTAAKPITTPAKYVADKAAIAIGKIGAAAFGVSTGVGPQPIKEAFEAGRIGIRETPFAEALRGKTTEMEIVEMSSGAVEKLVESRGKEYRTQFEKLGLDKKVIDDTSIQRGLQNELAKFRISVDKRGNLDFSRSPIRNTPEAVNDIKTIYEDVSGLGKRGGLEKTALGLDSLKKGIGALYSPTSRARAFTQSIEGIIDNALKGKVPKYAEMTAKYAKTSALLKDIKSSLSTGKATETTFNKLTQALRIDNQFRIELINQLEGIGMNELTQRIAGITMKPLAAKGLVGRSFQYGTVGSVIAGILSPKILLGLVMTSPRIAGEFIQALGFGVARTSALMRLINEIRIPIIPAIGASQKSQLK